MKRYCFALDLNDDPDLIAEYIDWHTKVWPEIKRSIAASGITNMEIYRVSNRMVMMMDTTDAFSLEHKAQLDAANPRVQEWEKLMWKYQKPLPFAKPGEKWMLMEKIFQL
ncbi:MAG: L-rhamnose mutarotase [Cyclobacteriaceae bacterium]|nr:L-rhamnose mutarotase [Cyclobacteriaceae bacterium]